METVALIALAASTNARESTANRDPEVRQCTDWRSHPVGDGADVAIVAVVAMIPALAAFLLRAWLPSGQCEAVAGDKGDRRPLDGG